MTSTEIAQDLWWRKISSDTWPSAEGSGTFREKWRLMEWNDFRENGKKFLENRVWDHLGRRSYIGHFVL